MLWLGVVVVVCEGVTPVAPGVPVVADGVVWVAEGLPVVAAPPGAVVVELTPGCVPDVPAVPVAVPPVLPVVCAAATPMARAMTHEASKVFCMKMLLGAASWAAALLREYNVSSQMGCGKLRWGMVRFGAGDLLPYNVAHL